MNAVTRPITHRYADPLDLIWRACAARVGFRVERSDEVYASTDGRGTLLIGKRELLDPDDCLAQMIFHELCHALIEGDEGEAQADWGLDNTSNRHLSREQACLRLQAYLAEPYGLRVFLAPTTDFRIRFWDALPADPFLAETAAEGRREPSCVAARIGAWRASLPRWQGPLTAALTATAELAALVSTTRDEPAGRAACHGLRSPVLWDSALAQPARHPVGQVAVAAYYSGHGCADCAWSFVVRGKRRCRHAPAVPLPGDAPACTRWEAADELDCHECGACCREAYQAVEVGPQERVNRRHPELVFVRDGQRRLQREGARCAALSGGETAGQPFGCTIYADRPRTCREFERASAHCLDARRRVGLSL